MTLTWHQQRAARIAAAAIRSGLDVERGARDCSCCGVQMMGPLNTAEANCYACDDGCNPADSWHCFTGYCDGSGCTYSGECHLPRDFEAEFSEELEDHDGVTVEVYKLGGGTVGKSYVNDWAYRASRDGEPFYAGSDLHTGTPKTHAEVAAMLIDYMESRGALPEVA